MTSAGPWLFVLLVALSGSGSGCGVRSPEPTTVRWAATADPLDLAKNACGHVVDDQMRLRGYPRRPSPETPQARYRELIFTKCMRDKGYQPETE